MRAVVLYESVYGNTEAVARAIAEGLAPIGGVTLARFGDLLPGAVEEADLVVLGGPTHGWGMTRPDVGLGDLGVQINLWMHLLGSAALIAIVLLPAAHDWVTRRL